MKRTFKYGLIALSLCLIILLFWFVRLDIPLETLKAKYTNADSKFVEIAGMPVHYRDEGKGKVIVLLHGTAASLHTWEVWADSLKQHYRVISLDLPAFGLTGAHPQRDYSIPSYCDFLKAFLDKLSVKKCSIAGNSLGGRIAWAYALEQPKMVESLILIDAAGYPREAARPWVFRLATTPILNQIVRYVTPRFFFEKNLKAVYADDSKINAALIDRYYELNLREGNRQAFIDRAKTTYEDQSERIKNIQCPTLIQWGAADEWIPVKHAQYFQRDIAKSQLIIYPEAGHVPMEEIPEKTRQDALNFLQNHLPHQ